MWAVRCCCLWKQYMDHMYTLGWMRDLLLAIYTANYGMFFSAVSESKYLIAQLGFKVFGNELFG